MMSKLVRRGMGMGMHKASARTGIISRTGVLGDMRFINDTLDGKKYVYTPEELFLEQFKPEKRRLYNIYIKLPGTIFQAITVPPFILCGICLIISPTWHGMSLETALGLASFYIAKINSRGEHMLNNFVADNLDKNNRIVSDNAFASLELIRKLSFPRKGISTLDLHVLKNFNIP
jgi:hypothetical protein